MAHFDAVIFDLDGTLADSLGDIGGAMNETLAAHGFAPHPIDAYRTFVGEGVEVLARHAGDPIMAREGTVLVATFHPEVTGEGSIHRYFCEMVMHARRTTTREITR